MSNGFATLLQAAQYIEQQEKLKLSPITTTITANNEQQNHQHRLLSLGSYDAPMNGITRTTATTSATNNHNNPTTTTRINSNGRHQQQQRNYQQQQQQQQQRFHVSSSAPAAGATFQHTNGLTITATSAANGSNAAAAANVVTGNGSQLITATNNHHRRNNNIDFEFSGGNVNINGGNFAGSLGNGVTIIATAAAAAATVSAAGVGVGSSSNSSLSPSSSPVAATATSSSSNGRSSEGRMSEDEFSSPSSPPSISQKLKSPVFLSLAASKQLLNASQIEEEQEQKHEQQQQIQQQLHQQQQHQHNLQQQQQQHNENNSKLKSFTLIDATVAVGVGSAGSDAANGTAVRNVAGIVGSKQMLLNGGIRIAASPASVPMDVTPTPLSTLTPASVIATSPKMISLSQHQHQQIFANTKLLATSSPSQFSLHGAMSRHQHHKAAGIPLTPPPNASRKLSSEPYLPRIRSYSMNSHKISALLHNGGNSNSSNSNSNSSSHHMMVDDTSPSMHLSGSNHSPPRYGGNHYMQMSGSQGSSHSHIAHCGRRRTISSNSNGAGTREVHNILEKNRRAHLKCCYDDLKNELSLNDEERSKKTSNLAVLNEALKTVKSLQVQEKGDETEMEQLAKEKIILQKRIVNLKRELGPKCEQSFPDSDLGGIPSERDNGHDSASLSSGRGSTLYSSSSSLSSGGSSNIMFSPVGAGLNTATPTAISPVITKLNNSNNNSNNHNHNNTTAGITNLQQLQQHSNNNNHNQNSISNNTSTTTTVISLTDSPSSTNNGGGLPLITRGSPTPSTPSPSPSSSSGVSSSCSLISSSPPMSGGVISNGRSVTVNIPFHQTNSGGATIGTIGNGTASAAATIIATTPPQNGIVVGSNAVKNNNAAHNNNNNSSQMVATTSISTSLSSNNNSSSNMNGYRRKTSLSISDDGKATLTTTTIKDFVEDAAQQPAAKCIKVFNGLVTKENIVGKHATATSAIPSSSSLISTAPTSLQLSQVVGGGSLVVSPSFLNAVTNSSANATLRTQKLLMNGVGVGGGQNGGPNVKTTNIILNGTTTGVTNELGRLPGGAELNILPSNGAKFNVLGAAAAAAATTTSSPSSAATTTTAFYHANGKLTLVNGGVGVGGNGGILLKDTSSTNAAITPIIVSTTQQNSTSNIGGGVGLASINTSTNFAQLLAASSVAPQNLASVKHMTPVERLNGKLRLSIGVGQERLQINAQPSNIGSNTNNMMKPMIMTMSTGTTTTPTQQQIGTTSLSNMNFATTITTNMNMKDNSNNKTNNFGTAALVYSKTATTKYEQHQLQQQQEQQKHVMPAMPTKRSQLQQKCNNIRFQPQSQQHQQLPNHQHFQQLQQSTIQPLFTTKTKRTAPPITPTTTSFLTTTTTTAKTTTVKNFKTSNRR